MDKLTYASDTVGAVPGADLSVARYYLAAAGARDEGRPESVPAPQSPNTGYYGGGQGAGTLVDKTDFTNDTTAAVPGASFTAGSPASRSSRLATGNSTAGYFGGGTSPGDGTTVMEKITYSSDTPSAVSSANLSTRRYGGGAVGNNDFGYFGGGQSGGTNLSTMDKLTYSTETTAELPSAPLSIVRYRIGATGNSTVGYFAGGTPGNRSTIDKLTYATDTLAANPSGGSLTVGRNGVAAVGDSDKGYFAGGGIRSMVDKLTYSNDTCAQVPGADMSVARMVAAGASNSSAGYIGGGSAPSHGGTTTMMDKLDFSSDTTEAVPGAGLSAARGSLSATSARSNAIPALPPVPIPHII